MRSKGGEAPLGPHPPLKTLCFPIKRWLQLSLHPSLDLGLCLRDLCANAFSPVRTRDSVSEKRQLVATNCCPPPWASPPHLRGEGLRSGADDSLQARSLPAKGGAPAATSLLASALLAFHQWGTTLTGTPLSPRGHRMTKGYEDRCTEASG